MRLIDADAYQKALEDKAEQLKSKNIIDDALNDTINGLCGAVSILYEQPTVQSHKTGHWIIKGETINCSACKRSSWSRNGFENVVKGFNYCPNCGARMREEEK